MTNAATITAERIERALGVVAVVVAQEAGAAYLPLFERLETELETARRRGGALERARALAERRTAP